jgi:hypothetical protein
MNKLFYILIFFFFLLNVQSLKSRDKYSYNNAIKIKYDRDLKKGWNYFGLTTGLMGHLDKDEYFYGKYTGKESTTSRLEYLQLGVGLKTKDFVKLSPKLHFILYDLVLSYNLKESKQKIYVASNAFNSVPEIYYKDKINWVNFGVGYGYDFHEIFDHQIFPLIFLKLGYNTYNIDNNIIDKFSNTSKLNFTNFDLTTGAKLNLIFDKIGFIIDADYTKVFDSPNLDIKTLNTKFFIINYGKKWRQDICYGEYIPVKNLSLFLSCNYKIFSVKSEVHESISYSLGFDYYFDLIRFP